MVRLSLREFADQALAYARSHNREWGVRLGDDNRLIYVGPDPARSGAVDLTGLYHAYLRSGGAPEPIFAGALDLASRSEASLEFGGSAARLVPLLVTPEFVRSSHAQPGAARLVAQAWTPGLSIAVALDQPERFEFVTTRHTERWGVTIAAAEQRAFRNLRERTPQAWQRDLPRDEALEFSFGDALASSRLLFALDVAPATGARTLLAVPDRNVLRVLVTAEERLVSEFRWLTASDHHQRSSRPLSPAVYERIADGLAVLDPPAEAARSRVRRTRLRIRRRG
jgi:hypothetical protein